MSEEMLDLIILYPLKVYQKMLIYNFVFGQRQYNVNYKQPMCLGRCLVPRRLFVADVKATVYIWC